MKRVHYDELDLSADCLVLSYQGVPFTGVAYEDTPAGRFEAEYVDGMRDGVSRAWTPTGSLASEEHYRCNVIHGLSREWREGGQLNGEALYELGICVRRQQWDESGRVLVDFSIGEEDPQYSILVRLRTGSVGLAIRGSRASQDH